jgi:hypothetical protein
MKIDDVIGFIFRRIVDCTIKTFNQKIFFIFYFYIVQQLSLIE